MVWCMTRILEDMWYIMYGARELDTLQSIARIVEEIYCIANITSDHVYCEDL